MSSTTYRGNTPKLPNLPISRSFIFGGLIFTALIAFELFNFSTTEFSLADLLGSLEFMGIRWATILAIAFCGIDFAGIARLFTPEKGADEPAEVWYLFAAWLLAAAMNAILTWWGVSVAIVNHQTSGSAVIAQQTLLKIVPVFVAIMVWVIRVLIIGTFSVAGEHLLWQNKQTRSRSSRSAATATRSNYNSYRRPLQPTNRSVAAQGRNTYHRPSPKPQAQNDFDFMEGYSHPEPTYHNLTATARPARSGNNSQIRR